MGYVPGFTHDLFFSYAQNDSEEWIRALEESLRQHLRERLGLDVDIWQDKRSIRFGQNWTDEIREGVRASAAFLAILSPGYRNSEWCAEERRIFLEHCKRNDQFKAGRYHRFLKLVKFPWADDAHEKFHKELQQINFFERTSDGQGDVEFTPGTNEFRAKVREASRNIAALLAEMRRAREAIFVASSTEDCVQVRTDLRRELRAQGYDVRPDGPIDEGFADDLIRPDMEHAVLSVHILGAAYDPFVEHQIDLAIEADQRLVFWLTPAAENSHDQQQRKLVESLKLEQKQKGRWELLTHRSARSVIQDVLGMLRPKSLASPSSADPNSASVYLICDPTTPTDAERARRIQAEISDVEKMQVYLPGHGSGSATGRSEFHQKLLRECDGLLLYRNAAPERWLYQTLPDVLYAERLVQRPPVRSKAFLLNDPSMLEGIPGVPVLSEAGDFRLADLEVFLAPLRARAA